MPRLDHYQDLSYSGNISPGETSRTLNDVVPSPDATHDLGKSTANGDSANERWRNLAISGNADIGGTINTSQLSTAPVQIGSIWYPGSLGGTASAPSTAPATSFSTSGGTLADGTYYAKITYVNRNGETTPSPVAQINLTGGGGNGAIKSVAQNDTNWQSGCYGVKVYLSNDGTNFYLQSPSVSTQDFMPTTTVHYATMGSGVRKMFPSPTFSGTTPPTTNTATIDPLQVALNATRRVSDRVPFGTLIVPALDSTVDTRTLLTTPLIVRQGDHIIGSGTMADQVNWQSRIVTSTVWADNKLAAVMMFGGNATIQNVGIQGQGTNALMALGGVGNQLSGGTVVEDSSLRVSDVTNTYSAFVAVGILYNIHFDNVGMVGGNALVQFRNAAGGLIYFTGGRWDASGDHFINMVPGWTDPDNGTNDAGFPNGLGTVVVKNVRTEGGKGILWDVMGLNLTLDTVEVADALVQAGTAALIRMGQDSTFSQVNGSRLALINTTGGSSSNAAAGIKVNAGSDVTFITLEGDSGLPVGSSTGSNVGVDANNIQLYLTDLTSSTSTANPNASGAAVKLINVPNSSRIAGGGGGSGLLADGGQWFEIPDRLVLTPHTGNNAWDRSLRRSWRNVSGTLNLYASDDTTVHEAINTNGDHTITRFLTVGANSPTGAAVGTSGIGLANGKAIWNRNAANTTDLFTFFVNASDQLELGTAIGIADIRVTKQIVSSLATGTAPFSVASTTNVANLNASSLNGATFAAPGAIGGGTPGSGAFTTVSASGQVTSTVSTGTAPLVISSTTNVANLNASSLSGATFAAPGPVGSTTPGTGAFTAFKWGLVTKVAADSPYTVGVADTTLLCNAVGGAITFNLPAAASSTNRILVMKKIDASGNACTLDGSGAETIDGAGTLATSTQYTSYTVQCDGSAWYVI